MQFDAYVVTTKDLYSCMTIASNKLLEDLQKTLEEVQGDLKQIEKQRKAAQILMDREVKRLDTVKQDITTCKAAVNQAKQKISRLAVQIKSG